ncbi:DUF2797 domain-containing protein [Parabacteroides sp. 52]|uniref:DUF2797 domain-containing protein n=1 Tax=unclassified Parabacteroides TaxID=2649774 RepID=UPI0013D0C01A|nr:MULTISPECIES: DUF2797 domain-containing protein [unclassified Parabacteroides]MDH6535663.1 hypothetical protein [Parabacteroides sp. PM5-20]NDV56275.1 DUF2797 domain-containing protein [Parabacteroides sp. 52]
MHITGCLSKMSTVNESPIHYYLHIADEVIDVNALLGKSIKIRFMRYQCVACGKEKEIFAMGCCKHCYFTSPHTGQWVVRPELSMAHTGRQDRDLAVEAEIQLQPHIVYLAHSGGIKVGVTRKSQLPTRWIDQGAEYAIRLAETKNRYEAGLIEVALKQHLSDKTNYRKMLAGPMPFEDLSLRKKEILPFVPSELQEYILEDNEITHLRYPVNSYPTKVNSVTLKKHPELEGMLMGIKGQYLIFNGNRVFNIRNHEGFVVSLE